MFGLGFQELLLILIILSVETLLVILPFWKIFDKAGFSKWLSLLMILPPAYVILVYVLAFAKWPGHNACKPSGR